MKIVIDVLGAPADSGGMRLYAEEIVRSWKDVTNDDELVVVGGSWIRAAFEDLGFVQTHVLPSRHVAGRALAQLFGVAWVYWAGRANAVQSVSPIVTPLVPRTARGCVVHDWRHLKRPAEFGAMQRWYRRLWRRSIRTAGWVAVISRKTLSETRTLEPTARVSLVENGRDHPRRWSAASDASAPSNPRIVTFGHHPNKRPELVIEAAARLRGASECRVVVLGARGEYADRLRTHADGLGLGARVDLPGFVEAGEYQRIIAGASVVVLASTDEGFGLPVPEAQYFGIPVIGTTDSGLGEIHEGLVVVEPTVEALASAIQHCLDEPSADRSATPPERSWSDVASDLRSMMVSAVGARGTAARRVRRGSRRRGR